MNAPFSEVFRTLSAAKALRSAFLNTAERMQSETRAAQIVNDQNKEGRIRAVQDATQELLDSFEEEKAQRRCDAEALLSAAESTVRAIDDPHFSRTHARYLQKAGESESFDAANLSPAALFTRMQKDVDIIQTYAEKIKNAFFYPEAAAKIGLVSPDFRKELYAPIAHAQVRLYRAREAAENADDLFRKADRARAVRTRKIKAIEADHLRRRAAITEKYEADMKASLARANDTLSRPPYAALFAPDAQSAPLSLGSLHMTLPNGKVYTAPLTCRTIDRSVLFLTDSAAPHTLFCALAADILRSEPDAVVHFADIARCGSAFGQDFSAFEPIGRAKIWRRPQDFLNGMETLCRCAAGSSARHTHYVFIEDLAANVPEQATDDLLRLLRANSCVRVLLSVNEDDVLPHSLRQKFPAFLQNAVCCTAKNGGLFFSADLFTAPPKDVSTKRERAFSAVTVQNQKAAVLSLGPHLPDAPHWQKKSSETGIFVPVGQNDQTGTPVTLALTESAPYALVIGDVNSGKSALLHTVAMQIFANYAPSEVRLAIGDFKEGAEFELYGTRRLPAVEAVVENDDPDAAASFLAYYAAELSRRQSCFSALSAETGRLIRKYETYRAVQRETGIKSETLPRILLLIDEYQSLFEGNPQTAALLGELVRKGRTYGIHLLMASQRGVSDSARSTFTSGLKDYFSTRFVFRCPPTAARQLLSDRCADTGRENSGIAASVLLKTGHALMNTQMGQTERGTVSVQCYYGGDALLMKMCALLPRINGTGSTVLLRYNAASRPAPDILPAGKLLLGDSVCLYKDRLTAGADCVEDNATVSFTPDGSHILCLGHDLRVPASVIFSAARFAVAENLPLRVFCPENHPILRLLPARAEVFTAPAAQKTALSSASADAVNIFVEMSRVPCFTQPLGTLRPAEDAALLQNAIETSRFSVVFERRFQTVRSVFSHLLPLLPVRLIAPGDSENLRLALPDTARVTPGAFDTPQKASIRAYYCNLYTEKFGKTVLFLPA